MPSPLDNLRVVLVDTRNPLNLGAAARALSNFGTTHLRVVRPYDRAFRDARSAVGAAELMARAEEFDSVTKAIADCRLVVGTSAAGPRDLQHELLRLEQGARLIRKRLRTGPVALLFGSERYGLSNEELSHCHWLMRIPTRDGHRSMNLGQAVAVCLYELVRMEKLPPVGKTGKDGVEPAVTRDIERLNTMLLEVLRDSGYVQPNSNATAEVKLRRLVRRLHLNSADAAVLQGMVRQISWKLGGGGK
jgi:tRNA/rRNA methyltransferase